MFCSHALSTRLLLLLGFFFNFICRSAWKECLFFHIGNYNNTRDRYLIRLSFFSLGSRYILSYVGFRLAKIKFPKNNSERSTAIVSIYQLSAINDRSPIKSARIRHLGKLARASFPSFHFSCNSKCKNCNGTFKTNFDPRKNRAPRPKPVPYFSFPFSLSLSLLSLSWFGTNRGFRACGWRFSYDRRGSPLFAYYVCSSGVEIERCTEKKCGSGGRIGRYNRMREY